MKTNLVIEAVAAAEGFDATEEEIQKEINDLAAEYNMEVSQVSALLSPEMPKHDITMKKAKYHKLCKKLNNDFKSSFC